MATVGNGILTVSFDQGAAGATDLVTAAGAGRRIVVLGVVASLDAAGTLKFQSNASTDLTGAMPLATATPLQVMAAGVPLFATAANEKLNIVSATGKAKGFLIYTIDG